MTSNILALSPLLLAAACFADLAIFCLGMASVSASSPIALSWSLVTNTWDPAAVFSLDLRGVAVLGAGLNTGGRAANRGCWLVLAKPGTANDDLKSIAN